MGAAAVLAFAGGCWYSGPDLDGGKDSWRHTLAYIHVLMYAYPFHDMLNHNSNMDPCCTPSLFGRFCMWNNGLAAVSRSMGCGDRRTSLDLCPATQKTRQLLETLGFHRAGCEVNDAGFRQEIRKLN